MILRESYFEVIKKRKKKKNNIRQIVTPPHHPSLNPVEMVIRELRKRWYRAIFLTNCSRSLWKYGLPHSLTDLANHLDSGIRNHGSTLYFRLILSEYSLICALTASVGYSK